MTSMVTIGRWGIDLDNFTIKDFDLGESMVTVTIDGKEEQQKRYN